MNTDFDWTAVRAFLLTVQTGSFTAAGEVMSLSQPTVGRRVAALEEQLGLVLFERSGRVLTLTEAGRQVLEHATVMQEAATALSLTAAGQTSEATGLVSISCSDVFAVTWLPDVFFRLRRDYPGLALEVVATNSISNLARREADIAIRHVRPDQPELIGRKLADTTAGLYASRSYLEQVGPLLELEDLQRADFIAFDQSKVMIQALRPLGVHLTSAHFPVVTASSVMQLALCRRGVGLCFLSDVIGDRDPELVRVLPSIGLPVPIWLVCHQELRTTLRFRVVFDALAEHISGLVPSPDITP